MISFSQFSIFYFKLLDLGMSCCKLLSFTLKLIAGWVSGRSVFVAIFLYSRFNLGWPGSRCVVYRVSINSYNCEGITSTIGGIMSVTSVAWGYGWC